MFKVENLLMLNEKSQRGKEEKSFVKILTSWLLPKMQNLTNLIKINIKLISNLQYIISNC